MMTYYTLFATSEIPSTAVIRNHEIDWLELTPEERLSILNYRCDPNEHPSTALSNRAIVYLRRHGKGIQS